MANFFEQFDEPKPNFFAQFDEGPEQQPQAAPPSQPEADPLVQEGLATDPSKTVEAQTIPEFKQFMTFEGTDPATSEPMDVPVQGVLEGEAFVKRHLMAPIMMLTTSDQELADMIVENFPNITQRKDAGGNIILTNTQTGVENIMNRPGISQSDILGIGSNVALMLPMAKLGQGLGWVGRLLTGALVSGTAETGIQGAQELAGGKFNPQDVVFATAAAPLGELGMMGIGKAFSKGAEGIRSLFQSSKGYTEEGAARILAEQMIREGLTPDQVAKQFADLGPEAIPADVATGFGRLLRSASNYLPRIEGKAAEVLSARHSGQSDRILKALDDASGTSSLNVDDELLRLSQTLGPQITALYEAAGEGAVRISPEVRKIIEGKGLVGKLRNQVTTKLNTMREVGEKVGNIELIDVTKKTIDDKIGEALRAGRNDEARLLVMAKNKLVDLADESIPVYGKARELYAGKAALEGAADLGTEFLKMKSRMVQQLASGMGASEKQMFKLGAKRAILDKLDDMATSADAAKRLFGKNGDVEKLKSLFDDGASYNQFKRVLQREADYVITKRLAQENSTTIKQALDELDTKQILGLGYDLTRGNIAGGLSRMIGLSKNPHEVIKANYQVIGDILLDKGMKPADLQALLKRGNASVLAKEMKKVLDLGPAGRLFGAGVAAPVISEQSQ